MKPLLLKWALVLSLAIYVQGSARADVWQQAEQGDATAQYMLGVQYDLGTGVEKNDAVAVTWYRKSADQGHVMVQSNLAYMYAMGEGVFQSYAEAAKW